MPFRKQIARPFTRAEIDSLSDAVAYDGVYGLFRDNQPIYIGRGEIKTRLDKHLAGDNACITRERPTHFLFDVMLDDPVEREKELIKDYNPICNKRVG